MEYRGTLAGMSDEARPDAFPVRIRRLAVERYLTAADAARALGVERRTITRWIREGLLPARRYPGRWQIAESDIREFGARPSNGGELSVTVTEER